MEEIAYQRPREKLQNKGVGALSVVELLQVIIGAGSSKISGAKIARSIERLFIEGDITFKKLADLPGVGTAKACQVLAALELSWRYMNRE